MEYEIVMATEEDRNEILALYKAQIGQDYCPWDEDYPSNEAINWDLSRDALFIMKMNGSIKLTFFRFKIPLIYITIARVTKRIYSKN